MTRPELAVRDGYVLPSDIPDGVCDLTRLDDGRIRVDRADPRILISAELLDSVNGSLCMPDDRLPLYVSLHHALPGTYAGAVMTIRGVNRTVIYLIGEYLPSVHGYIAEWSD